MIALGVDCIESDLVLPGSLAIGQRQPGAGRIHEESIPESCLDLAGHPPWLLLTFQVVSPNISATVTELAGF
jgi:hypothetical protein